MLLLLPLFSPTIYSYKGITPQFTVLPMKCCEERQILPASDLDNEEMSLFWAENRQVYLCCYLALYCHAQAPPPKSGVRSACNYIWAQTLCSQWNCLHSAFRDRALPWSFCQPLLSSQLIKTANQAVIEVSTFVFYSCLIFLPWDVADWFWRFI